MKWPPIHVWIRFLSTRFDCSRVENQFMDHWRVWNMAQWLNVCEPWRAVRWLGIGHRWFWVLSSMHFLATTCVKPVPLAHGMSCMSSQVLLLPGMPSRSNCGPWLRVARPHPQTELELFHEDISSMQTFFEISLQYCCPYTQGMVILIFYISWIWSTHESSSSWPFLGAG